MPIVKQLEVVLTDEEVSERAKMHAMATLEWEATKAEAKESSAKFAGLLKAIRTKEIELASAVNDRKERRPVECEERVNDRLFQVETWRLDTNEMIDRRPMKDDELASAQQPSLPGLDDADEEPADAGTLATHPVLDTLHGPDDRVPCPGPAGEDGEPTGCEGGECSRCAGLLQVPAESVAMDRQALADEADPGGEPEPEMVIDSPEALLAVAGAPEAKPTRRRRGTLPATDGTH